jgi:hypothetical protein
MILKIKRRRYNSQIFRGVVFVAAMRAKQSSLWRNVISEAASRNILSREVTAHWFVWVAQLVHEDGSLHSVDDNDDK